MASTLVLSFIASFLLLVSVVLSHCIIVILCIQFFPSSFSHTLTKTTPVTLRLCVRFYYTRAFIHSGSNTKTSASFENANGFYLWPAAVTEWAIVLREVFVCSCVCKCVCKNWAPLVKISLCECAND